MVHPDVGILFSIKQNQTIGHEKVWRALNACYYMKEANLKRLHILYDSSCMTFWKSKTMETIKNKKEWLSGVDRDEEVEHIDT